MNCHRDLLRTSVFLVTIACGEAQQPCETDACASDATDGTTGTSTETDGETGTDTSSEATCGDGILDPGETCDDANLSNTDGCLDSCTMASCGDGHVWATVEECDDGNAADDDACTTVCTNATCGDGIVWTGMEACDDGNTDEADECLSDCTLSPLPKVGDACDINYLFQCVPKLDSGAGTPLLCEEGVLTETDEFAQACMGLCPVGSNVSVEACGGWGEYAICLCLPLMPQPCDEAQLGCTGPDSLALCYEGQAVIGECPSCMLVDGYYTCDW